MEKPSKFDRAIQDKLSGMQAEPSARVWSQVRAEIGGQVVQRQTPWLRIAAGAAIFLMAGGTAIYLVRNAGQHEDTVTTNAFAGKHERVWNKHKSKQDSSKVQSPEVLEYTAPQPRRAMQSPTFANLPQNDTPSDQPIQPMKEEAPTYAQEKLTPVPDAIKPKLEQQVQQMEVIADAATESSEMPSGSKKSYRIPSRQDLAISKLRENSKNILETLAENADSKLGIPTEYTRKSTEDGEMTAFSLDLGFVKFRKVRSSK